MFGLKKTNTTSDRIYSVYGALHFGDGITENYLGKETVRGIPCNKWQSCQYWPEMDATSTVIWYFSGESGKEGGLGTRGVGVGCGCVCV